MLSITKQILDCFNREGKVIIFGNGGSMAEASHFATELIGIGKPAIALSDPATITALANDNTYEDVFLLWIHAIGREGDLAIGISSSGKSKNINKAYDLLPFDMKYIDFPRKGKNTSEVQNNQLKLIHKIYKELK